MFADMKHGEVREYAVRDQPFKVHYYSAQAYGDDNRPVPGVVTGTFTVEHPSGRVTHHNHGPFAETAAARKRGASRDSKVFAADQAFTAMKDTAARAYFGKGGKQDGYY